MGLAAQRAALILAHSTQIYDTVNGPAADRPNLQCRHYPREPG